MVCNGLAHHHHYTRSGKVQMKERWWSGEVQVNIRWMSNFNLSLTLVDVKLVYFPLVLSLLRDLRRTYSGGKKLSGSSLTTKIGEPPSLHPAPTISGGMWISILRLTWAGTMTQWSVDTVQAGLVSGKEWRKWLIVGSQLSHAGSNPANRPLK